MTTELGRLSVTSERHLTRPTVILRHPVNEMLIVGSSQSTAHVHRGVPTVRRRGGGGAVLAVPDEMVWIDLWIPAGSALADADVARGLHLVGGIFHEALERVEVRGLDVVTSPPAGRRPTACFDAVGHGELISDGAKLLGIAAWRSRQGSLFQSALYRHRVPDAGKCFTIIDRTEPCPVTSLLGVGAPLLEGREIAEAVKDAVSDFESADLWVRPPTIEATTS